MTKSFFTDFLTKVRLSKIPRRSASLAFYAIYALAPMIILFVSVSGLIIGHSSAESEILNYFSDRTGGEAGLFLEGLLESIQKSEAHLFFSSIGILIMLYGLLHFFNSLRESLFDIFGINLNTSSTLKKTFFNYIRSLGVSLYTAFLVLMLMLINALAPAILSFSADTLGFNFLTKIPIGNFLAVFLLTIPILALMYKSTSMSKVSWQNAFIGATIGAILFSVINLILLWYFSLFNTAHAVYGASASLVALLLWVYYSSQVLLFGAVAASLYDKKNV